MEYNNNSNFNFHSDDYIADDDIKEIITIDDKKISSDSESVVLPDSVSACDNELEMSEVNALPNEESHYINIDEELEIDCQEETFQAHNGSVFCAAMPKFNSIKFSKCILTGGEDDYAYIWNSESFIKLSSIKHKDSVISVGFNSIGDYALTADMSGLINIFKYPELTKPHYEFETTDIDWCFFHPLLPRVIIAGLKNWQIQIWELPTCQFKLLIPPYDFLNNCVEILSAPCVEFLHKNPSLLIAGYFDGTICIWDIKNASILYKHSQRHGFDSNITCIKVFENDQIFAASSDSSPIIKIYNLAKGEFLYELNYYKLCQNSSVESLLTDQFSQFIISATIVNQQLSQDINLIGGQLCVWNFQNRSFFGCLNFKDGITKMCLFSLNPHWVLIGLLNGSIGLIDFFKGEILSILHPHSSPILNENIILSTSDDGGTMCLRVGKSSNIEFNNVIDSI